MGFVATAMVFGFFSLFLWLAVSAAIPWLRDSHGISPIFGWYLSGTVLVLAPTLIFGSAKAWLELPAPTLSEWRRRLRLVPINRGDAVWTIVGLVAIMIASGAILALARYLNPNFQPTPAFLAHTAGWNSWIFAAWTPLFVTNIPWCLFHWSLGWPIVVMLLPIALLLPWIVQRRRNTTVGIIIHAFLASTRSRSGSVTICFLDLPERLVRRVRC